jgi:hypothetical protein
MRDPEIMAGAIDGQHSFTSGAYRAKIIVFISVQWLFSFNKEDDMMVFAIVIHADALMRACGKEHTMCLACLERDRWMHVNETC